MPAIELLVCDIDLTLADARQRAAKAGISPHRSNRKAFQRWLDRIQNTLTLAQDVPIGPLVSLVQVYVRKTKARVVYLTGRAEKYRKVTEFWLKKHRLPTGSLHMRGNRDWRSAAGYKKTIMLKLLRGLDASAVLVLDDDSDGDCSAMYTELGCVHLKVCLPKGDK